jgi:hypothetical protein
VKQSIPKRNAQLNLPLLDVPATVLPDNKQQELVRELVELLMSAANEKLDQPISRGSDESQAD